MPSSCPGPYPSHERLPHGPLPTHDMEQRMDSILAHKGCHRSVDGGREGGRREGGQVGEAQPVPRGEACASKVRPDRPQAAENALSCSRAWEEPAMEHVPTLPSFRRQTGTDGLCRTAASWWPVPQPTVPLKMAEMHSERKAGHGSQEMAISSQSLFTSPALPGTNARR